MRWTILGALVVGGCSTPDPCAGKSGTCISAHVDGNAHDLAQTRVTLPDGRATLTQASSGSIKLPAQFAILIPDSVPDSPFAVQLDGLRGGITVASDTENVSLTSGRGSVKFTLNEAGGGGSGGGGGGEGDMAVMNPPVVTGLDPVTVDEMTAISIDLSAIDPLGGNVVLSAASLPGNAVFTPNGAGGKLTWTPGYSDAGKYTVKVTATPDDTTRAATFDLAITIKNAADPILIAGNPELTAVPIGDWDKDGFGDLATCTGDAAGATGKYHFKVLYGSATGLPLDAAGGAGRVDSFDIDATTLGGSLYNCKGGDFDGDGHADIIFADPVNDFWGAGSGQGKFTVVFGGARGVVTPPSIFIVGNQNFGQHMGEVFQVGDFTNDGKADIATVWTVNADTTILIPGGGRSNQTMGGQPAQDYPHQGSPCAPSISIAMVDFNKDGNADWVLQSAGINLGASTGGCDATHMAAGGLRVISGRSAAPLLDGSNTTTYTEYYAPTAIPATDRYHWGRQAAGCDVDHDGYGDIGLLTAWTGLAMQHGEVIYGSAAGLNATALMPLPDSAANAFDVDSMQPTAIGCFGSYKAGQPALAVSSMATVGGPGVVKLYGGRPLALLGTMSSPSSGDSHFGIGIRNGNKTDVDGDGKEDLVVISDQSAWVMYGR